MGPRADADWGGGWMMRTVPSSLREHIELIHYTLLRACVAWLVPAAMQFDERDPLLGDGR